MCAPLAIEVLSQMGMISSPEVSSNNTISRRHSRQCHAWRAAERSDYMVDPGWAVEAPGLTVQMSGHSVSLGDIPQSATKRLSSRSNPVPCRDGMRAEVTSTSSTPPAGSGISSAGTLFTYYYAVCSVAPPGSALTSHEWHPAPECDGRDPIILNASQEMHRLYALFRELLCCAVLLRREE